MATLKEINEQNEKLASTIVRANITDWMGNILFESSNYNVVLERYFTYSEDDDVQLNSYDKQGNNHGIFY